MKRLKEQHVKEILARCSAVITGSHFVYANPPGHGDHGDAYVNKDAVYPHVEDVVQLCDEMSERLEKLMQTDGGIEVVVGLEKGGLMLSHCLTRCLNETYPIGEGDMRTLSVYAEKKEGGGFELRRGYDLLVKDRRAILVEDILNTGGSALEGVKAIRAAGGNVLGVIALVNRGGVTAESLGVPFLEALLSISDLKKYPEADCPICKEGLIPVREDLGHGKAFLARQCLKA